MECYPNAANEIKALGWASSRRVRWHNFAELRGMFKDADFVDGYVVLTSVTLKALRVFRRADQFTARVT